MKELDSLVGKDLRRFTIQRLTEVYMTGVEGGPPFTSLGYFKNPKIAKAYAGIQRDAPWFNTETRYVLTDGNVGFVIDTDVKVKLLDDEEARLKIVEAARKKLSQEEREALGME